MLVKLGVIAGRSLAVSGDVRNDLYYEKQQELVQKNTALASQKLDLQNKQNILQQKQNEFAGIDNQIAQKLTQYNSKHAEYNSVLQSFNEIKTWFDTYSYSFGIRDGSNITYYYHNKFTGQNIGLSRSERDDKINTYNSKLATLNQVSSQENSIVNEYNNLLAKKTSLPSEIFTATDNVNHSSDVVVTLQTEVNFINSYLTSFNGGVKSVIENAYLGDGNDTLIGNDQDNQLWGGRGHNTITGGAGKDVFMIKKDESTQDIITDFKVGEDKIDLSNFGNLDFASLSLSQLASDVVISFESGQKIILKNLQTSQVSVDSFIGIAGVVNSIDGTTGNDVLSGTVGVDLIKAGAGDDIVNGAAQSDYINGGVGNDVLIAGAGDDKVYGDEGDDVIYGDGDLNLSTYQVSGTEIQAGNDKLYGGDGDDTILGLLGNDYIDGGDGDDVIDGGAGNDIILGGDGTNEIYGGSGSDKFIISEKTAVSENKYDIIYDFDVSNPDEKIDLSVFANIDQFSDLGITQVGEDAYVKVKSDGNFGHYVVLVGVNASTLDSSNFIITNEAPQANNDDVIIEEDHSVTINLFANDSDDKTKISDLKKENIQVTNPQNGVVTINYDGTVTYKPNANFNGVDSFEYILTDSGGLTSKATVNVVVNAVNDAPIVVKIVEDQSFYSTKQISFKAGDIFNDADGDKLSYSAKLADGSPLPNWISFDPISSTFSGIAPNNSGAINVILTAVDHGGLSTSTSFNIAINDRVISGTANDDTINGTDNLNIVNGDAGSDIIRGLGGDDILFGGASDDSIYGDDGDDIIYGDGDLDISNYQVNGAETQVGNDKLYGGNGDDIIAGLLGDDYIEGSSGFDILVGGAGDDTYIFNKNDGVKLVSEYDYSPADSYSAYKNIYQKITVNYKEYATIVNDSYRGLGTDTIAFDLGITESDLTYFINGFSQIMIANEQESQIFHKKTNQLKVANYFPSSTFGW